MRSLAAKAISTFDLLVESCLSLGKCPSKLLPLYDFLTTVSYSYMIPLIDRLLLFITPPQPAYDHCTDTLNISSCCHITRN